jgi:hypothetical protein
MDDVINVFKRKEHAALEELIFRNRQPRFTVFNLQEKNIHLY